MPLLLIALASSFRGAYAHDYQEFAGRYANGPFSLYTVDAEADYLGVVPPFWTSKPYLAADDTDAFSMRIPHIDASRRVEFVRSESGGVVALDSFGFDADVERFERVRGSEILPIEHFLAGDVGATLRALADYPELDVDAVTSIASEIVSSYPSKHAEACELLSHWVARHPDSALLRALYGYALLADARRPEALAAFRAATTIDPDQELAAAALRRLELAADPAASDYRKLFPYEFDDLFAPPTPQEIAAVRRDWAGRDLRAVAVSTVATHELALEHATFDVRVLRYEVQGDLQFGAILVPRRDGTEKLPAVVEVRGVDPLYTPQDISTGTQLLRALGPLQDRFVFVVPALRGETLIVHGNSYTSSGDRADSWDGATDDAIAIVDVALANESQIDAGKLAIYGKSRGGSVALLGGIRDERFSLVLNLAGPVDWFRAMEGRFWTTGEILIDMLRTGAPITTTEEGGQFYERFVAPVAAGRWNLQQARHSMLAGSPAYFVETLPPTFSFYGAEDRAVPVANAELLRTRAEQRERPNSDVVVTIYAGRGHDTEPLLAFREMVNALQAWRQRPFAKQAAATP